MMNPNAVLKVRQRGSLSFSLEADLVGSLKRQLRRLLEETLYGDEFKFFTELPVGAIIPDLMVIRLPRGTGTRIVSGRKCQVPVLNGFVLSALLRSTSSLSEEEVASRLFVRPERIAPCLRRLEREGVIASRSGKYALKLGGFPRDAQIVAIEAKLTRWKDAIEQAESYLDFANQSYVALPDDIVATNPDIPKRCEDAGVGLISVAGDSVRIDMEAQFREVFSPGWSWVVLRSILLG